MFLLGEYCDEEARFVADCLKDAGMKVDIRTYTASEVETDHFLEGRMSELLAVLTEDERQKYERYLSALRNVLAEGASEEDWSERLADEIDPHREENRERLLQLISDSRQERERNLKRPAMSKNPIRSRMQLCWMSRIKQWRQINQRVNPKKPGPRRNPGW